MHTMSAPNSRLGRFLRPGAIMMALGSVLILAGVIQTTTSHFNTEQSCPSGSVLLAKFTYDNQGFNQGYDFDSPAGNQNVVHLSHDSADGAWFSSTKSVSAIVVSGGGSSVLYSIAPPQVTGSFSNSGLPDDNHHNKPDITSVQFCGPTTPVTTTTVKATTTTKGSTTTSSSTTSTTFVPPSSTCGQCQTTTTTTPQQQTTTTAHCGQCETTTTQPAPTTTHAPTTTCQCSTTTVHVSTSTCHCSTTTTQPHETTTLPEETTTTVPGTTTSSTEVSGSTIHFTTTTHHTATTVHGQGTSTSFGPTVSSTSVFTGESGNTLPFTGSSSTPIIVIGIVLLATGLTLTLSQARRRGRTTS